MILASVASVLAFLVAAALVGLLCYARRSRQTQEDDFDDEFNDEEDDQEAVENVPFEI